MEEKKTRQDELAFHPSSVVETQELLKSTIQDNISLLLGTIRSYVLRMGLAAGDQAAGVALEILQETATEALAHAERFNVQYRPMAWLLGIAMNMIRRRKVEEAKRARREELLGHLARRYPDLTDESELLDSLVPPNMIGPAQIVESNEQAVALLSLVSVEDRHILRIALLDGYERTAIASKLGMTPAAARMKLHRALGRLRAAWIAQQEAQQQERS